MMNFLGTISGGLLAYRPEDWVDGGKDFYRNKEYDKAIEYYTNAINMDPEYSKAYNNRGIAYSAKGDIISAEKDYLTAIALDEKINKGYPQARTNVAQIFLSRKEIEKAKYQYKAAIDAYYVKKRVKDNYAPHEHASAHALLGDLEFYCGNISEAIAEYDAAIGLETNDPLYYFQRAYVYANKAIKEFERNGIKSKTIIEEDLGKAMSDVNSAKKFSQNGVGTYGDAVNRSNILTANQKLSVQIQKLKNSCDSNEKAQFQQEKAEIEKNYIQFTKDIKHNVELIDLKVEKISQDVKLLISNLEKKTDLIVIETKKMIDDELKVVNEKTANELKIYGESIIQNVKEMSEKLKNEISSESSKNAIPSSDEIIRKVVEKTNLQDKTNTQLLTFIKKIITKIGGLS